MDLFEHYKDMYYKEIQRYKNLHDSLNTPIGIISVLITVLTYYISNFQFSQSFWSSLLFIILIAIASIFLAIAITNIIQVYTFIFVNRSSPFKYLPDAMVQDNYFVRLKQFHLEAGLTNADAQSKAQEEFETYLRNSYVDCSATNTLNNDLIEGLISSGRTRMIIALIFLIVSFVPFSINFALKPEKATKIEIIKSVALSLDSNTKKTFTMPQLRNTEARDTGQSVKSDTPQSTKYPTPPQGRLVAGGKVVKGRRLEKDGKTGRYFVVQ